MLGEKVLSIIHWDIAKKTKTLSRINEKERKHENFIFIAIKHLAPIF